MIFLFAAGYVGEKNLKHHDPVVIQELSPARSGRINPATPPPATTKAEPVPEKGSKKHPTGVISLTTATSDQLQTIPEIGPATAQKIIAYREAHHGFKSVDELTAVGTIGQKKLAKMRPYLKP